jgi:hypothetical protein
MIFAQFTMDDLGSSSSTQFYDCKGSIMSGYITNGNCSQYNQLKNNVSNDLPGSSASINPTTGFGFVDWIASSFNWINSKITFFGEIVSAPYNILNSIPGIPPQLVSVIAAFWYSLSILLLAGFIFGR